MKFNLSEWTLRHRSLVLYMMIVVAVAGAMSYFNLGRSEDPAFTFKAMVIRTIWPGATAEEVSQQVTERIEKKVMETGQYEFVRSYSRDGESQVIIMARDSLPSAKVDALWYQIRKKIGDIRPMLPAEVVGPFFNDEFGDTFGNIYSLTGKGFDYAQKKDYAERIQLQLQRVKDVGKVELIGTQDEKIWVEISNTKLATMGVPLTAVRDAMQQQNILPGSGFVDTASTRLLVRVSGEFKNVDDIRNFPISAGGKTFRLGDVAEVSRGFADPSAPRMRFNGQDAIGIGVAMKDGGDILELGKNLDATFADIQKSLPVGVSLDRVTDQPAAVDESVSEFMRVLTEAVVIVLLVSFFSLGLRTGLVVALSIPLVLAMTFLVMDIVGVGLHKISLGALVLALGLLVDDAIIAVEMMAIKLEEGYSRLKAAAFAWESTAFPMLTGTLITAAGFLPIGLAKSSVGEYTRSLFEVVTIALLVSWVGAVAFIPYLGDKLLKEGKHDGPAHDPHQTPFYKRFRGWVAWCVDHRRTVIAGTVAAFVASVLLFRFVPQQFFPDSVRPELMVDLELAEGSSLKATAAETEKLEKILASRKDIASFSSYVGTGAPRFYLPLDQQLPAANFAQFLITPKNVESRESIREWMIRDVVPKFPELQMRVTRLENGPPVGYPVQIRVGGEHIDQVRGIAAQVRAKVEQYPGVTNVNYDWDEPTKAIRLEIDQNRARALGVSSQMLSQFLYSTISGAELTTFREGNQLIQVNLRAPADQRLDVAAIGSLMVPTTSGKSVPVSQIADVREEFVDGIIWHRNREPTVTVRADLKDGEAAVTAVNNILKTVNPLRESLPYGYHIDIGGTVEDSGRGQDSIKVGVPLFLFAVFTLLMIQLRSFSRSFMVLLTAPLGLIGVTLFLLVFRVPFGFVAMLGTIALAGMIMRNSVILIDQIEQDRAAGLKPFDAIVESTVRRLRPIALTALAAILAMIPLSRSVFFGPMATAIMGGLLVATLLTLFFLPALYAAWFKVKRQN
ncbi:efflux RND transporter permease subunit [Luteimonas sp. FXH3W]|uniref:Efflux RND transporter permease subunit n=1 Tax=Aquilutibacter rugosus TaxID=3115820 RepID=A0ABU7UXZ7_9GAMM